MYKLGIDVGGTNTDAVILDMNLKIIASLKTPTTQDIYSGILSALKGVLQAANIDRKQIRHAMLGTTQCTNAIVERKKLSKLAVIRLAAPAMEGIKPMVDWPEDLKAIVEDAASVGGGYEHNGKEIASFDDKAARAFFERVKGKVQSVAISCVFSPIRSEHEDLCADLAREVLGADIHISKSSEIGSLCFIERENATILNAALYKVAASLTEGFSKSLADEGVTNAEVYLSQNDGTLMTVDFARRYPILTIACGPTNSIRGASFLSKMENAIVVDIGGTTTDFGVIQNGFPRESSIAVTIGGVRTNFRMPDVVSIGLGGGSIIREVDGKITVGPDSVGYLITREALVFGGSTVTATDIAVRLGMADIGDKSLAAHLDEGFCKRALAIMTEMIEDNIDKMKISSKDVEVVLVGGGSIIVPEKLTGTSMVIMPENFSIANAIGSAISKVSGTYEKLVSLDAITREKALEAAKQEAVDMAVAAGALRETVQIIDVEDVPLSYYAGNTSRIKVKAAGDLA